jgi:ATP-dependent exoDNAse (exonuclease V) alpha subunit
VADCPSVGQSSFSRREFSTGDRIQFTQNNKDLDVHNRDLGRIEAIRKDNFANGEDG